MQNVYFHTLAICPICRKKVNASIIEDNHKIYLRKYCPTHGITRSLVCSDENWFRESMFYVKPGQRPPDHFVKDFKGCPQSCGLCPEHRQHTCLPVIEITSECDLNCPVCLKTPGEKYQMTRKEFEFILDQLISCERHLPVINLSGGEPALHPELIEFLNLAYHKNIMQSTVSTNGLRFLNDAQFRELFGKSGAIAALQFDGFASETHEFLRGRDLSGEKLQIIRILEEEGIKYSLVATIVRNVNDREIESIVDFFFESGALSLMFQPAAFTGRAASMAHDELRVTIPDIVKEIEKSRYVSKGDFNPLPCSHFSCFALAYYLILDKGKFMNLKDFLGREQFLDVIANRTLPGLDESGYGVIKEKIYEFWSAADFASTGKQVLDRIKNAIREMNKPDFSPRKAFSLGSQSMKAIFIHQFMDVHTFDFGRVIKCCNHYPQKDGRLIPMCALNVFGWDYFQKAFENRNLSLKS